MKLAWLINDAGEVVDWTWDTAKLYHRVKRHLEAHLWYLAALINCLLRLTEHKRSLAEFVI
jgi:hypothetical protein